MGVLSSVGQAQVLTADTITGQVSTTGWYLNTGEAFSQTFTGAARLDLVTFRFIALNIHTSSITSVDIPFSLTAWSNDQSTAFEVSSGVFSIAAGSSWTVSGGTFDYFDSTFDFQGQTITPATTYGISLFGAPATNNWIGVGYVSPTSDALYASGTGFFDSIATNSNLTSLTTGNIALNYDLSFSATASPVPEASSAAVLFAGMFVGGLMVRRRRRQPADAMSALPVAQA